MPPAEHPDGGTPDAAPTAEGEEAGAAPLELAALAILGYLDDLAACRELCLRYEVCAGIVPQSHAMHLVVAVELPPEGPLAGVSAALESLPSAGPWRGGPAAGNGEPAAGGRKVIARHVVWEGEPLFVALVPEGFGLLRADVILPDRAELSRLPLRVAASGLRCLEFLLPGSHPVPLSELAGAPAAGLMAWLGRATPDSLPSRQCIWPAVEEQSPTPPIPPAAA